MPEYRWLATDQEGNDCFGQQWAISEQQLKDDLAKNNLTVTAAQRVKLAFIEKLSLDEQVQFFEQIQQMLDAGLVIEQTLAIVAQYGSALRCKIARELHACVVHGMTFADALALFPVSFSPLIITLARAGAASGSLNQALAHLCVFLRLRQDFTKRVRSALATPVITLAFFFVAVLVIFIGIVPSLEHVVQTINRAPTGALATLFNISHAVRSISLLSVVLCVGSCVLILWGLSRLASVRYACQWLLVHTPLVGRIYVSFVLASFLHALSLLLRGGQPIAQAIGVAGDLVTNEQLKRCARDFQDRVTAGGQTAQAFAASFGSYASVSSVALLEVGGETGTLALVVDRCAILYAEQATKLLKAVVLVMQPLLMIILGGLVAGLMYAVYVPLMQLPMLADTIS